MPVSNYGEVKSGIMVNSGFLKQWYEVPAPEIIQNARQQADIKGFSWVPINSGGGYMRWFGNNGTVVFLKNDARAIKESQTNYRLRDEKYYFRTGITWGRITSADLSFREAELGSVFGDAGPMLFIQSKSILHYVLGFLNSKLVTELSAALNPTLNFQVDDLRKLPLKIDNSLTERVDLIVSQNVDMCREFENNSELSSSFDRSSFTLHIAEHPLSYPLKIGHYKGYVPKKCQEFRNYFRRVDITW
ncbi:hypothetical protein [Lacticaseibacillus mingshuiensis]|uniref:Uncharacterized protein n=1 Tax=Lacticaseibacillus mingshuiensis TaxID=2799574 RepID=A0ABW4CG39_9LACO|nr:hypothetical protein [Lacticaseibacillus mingshuiensis]